MNTNIKKNDKQSVLYHIIENFRMWNDKWDNYNYNSAKPKTVDEFISDIDDKFVIDYKNI